MAVRRHSRPVSGVLDHVVGPALSAPLNHARAVTPHPCTCILQDYAASHNISFWAFVAYPPDTHLFYAQRNYLTVMERDGAGRTDVKFCLILDGNGACALVPTFDRSPDLTVDTMRASLFLRCTPTPPHTRRTALLDARPRHL